MALYFPTTYVHNGKTLRLPNPSMPLSFGFKANNLIIAFESGHEQRRTKGEMKRTVDINYQALHAGAAKVIIDFFISTGGETRSFIWTDPTDYTEILMRFDSNTIQKEYFAHNAQGPLYNTAFKLVQVL